MQFVLTTHSPFALGEVESRSIRLLSEFAVAEPTIETSGQDIGAISQRVQGAPQRPRDVDAMLIAAHAALDRSSLAEAEDQVGRLRERLGPHDPDVIRLIGRWRSDEMLRYLHVQAYPLMKDYARRMLSSATYTLIPNHLVPQH